MNPHLTIALQKIKGTLIMVFFTRAAQHPRFAVAARQLGTSPSSFRRAVQQLEEKLGTRLLNRTTRRIALTEDGAVFYEYCRQILSELEEAELALSKARAIPTEVNSNQF